MNDHTLILPELAIKLIRRHVEERHRDKTKTKYTEVQRVEGKIDERKTEINKYTSTPA